MKKNETVILQITGLNSACAGIGRIDGIVVFVPYALPGETVEALLIKITKNYCVGKLVRVLEASPDRAEPPCPYFYRCGGCDLQHLTPKAQLESKCKTALGNMCKLSGLPLQCDTVIENANLFGYRNKAQFPVGKDEKGNTIIGFFSAHSHKIVPMDACMLQDDFCNKALQAVKDVLNTVPVSVYDENTHTGILRHIVVRAVKSRKMVMLVTNSTKKLPYSFINALHRSLPDATLVQNIHTQKGNIILGKKCLPLWGDGYLSAELCGIHFRLHPLAFLQVNTRQAERLYERVLSLASLTGTETVFDAYCGIGIMSLCLAQKAKKVIGVEVVPEAIESAKESARENNISNASFLAGTCEEVLPQLLKSNERPDLLVVDPPRAGCEASLLQAISDAKIERIIYVSCDPATLARDMKILAGYGYEPGPLTFVDMFSQTKHVETVVLMSKNR